MVNRVSATTLKIVGFRMFGLLFGCIGFERRSAAGCSRIARRRCKLFSDFVTHELSQSQREQKDLNHEFFCVDGVIREIVCRDGKDSPDHRK